MARKKKVASNMLPKRGRQEESYGVTFINIKLTPEDVLHLREWEVDELDRFRFLEEMVDNGYKVSLSIDLENTGGIVLRRH